MLTFLLLLVSVMVIGLPAAGFAQFSDKGGRVEVKKGTRLCSSIAVDGVQHSFDQRTIFWRVTSPRKSGNTSTVENAYDEDFATFFKRAPEHKGMLQMISPQDGSVQAIVEICKKEQ